MIWFALRKLAGLVATMLVTAAIVYWLLATTPAAARTTGDFFGWLGHMLIGDFGRSAQTGGAVGSLVSGRLAVTVPLALLAMLLAAMIGFGAGFAAAQRPGSVGDLLLRGLAEIGIATPNFWLGMVLVLAVASGLHLLPTGGFVPWQDNFGAALASLLLPALALALPPGAALALNVRAALVAAEASLHVRAAQARGLTRREAMVRHGWRPALLTLGAPLTVQCAAVIAGTVIVENVFYLPGLGRLILDAAGSRDIDAIRAGLVVLALLISVTMFVVELGFGWLDPRRRTEVIE